MAQLPAAFSCHLSSVASRLVPLACTAKSMIVVVPPHAAAVVPVANVSTEKVPPNGISMCVCASIPPGITYLPAASTTSSALACRPSAAGRASTAAIFSPSMSTSASSVPSAVTTVPPLIRMLMALPPARSVAAGICRSRCYQAFVRVRAAVPVELPQVPDLGQLVHVQVTDDDLVGGVGGGFPDDLAARVREVGLAVEVVVAERLDPDPVDRADVVLVGNRGRRLLQLPQVRRQPARGRRRVEDDPRSGQAERPPAFGEVPVITDVDAYPSGRGVEHRVAEVAGPEVELLPEPLHLRNVVLPVFPEITSVRVDDRGRVVVQAGLLLLVHRHDDHDPVLPGQ